jgi:hypothetical protein
MLSKPFKRFRIVLITGLIVGPALLGIFAPLWLYSSGMIGNLGIAYAVLEE